MEETDIERSRAGDELRQCYLRLETVRQEKKVLIHQSFLFNVPKRFNIFRWWSLKWIS